MTSDTLDTAVAHRALRGAAGLMDAARATGTLDLSSMAKLLPALGVAGQPADLQALFDALKLPEGSNVQALRRLPWPGPARFSDGSLLVHGADARMDAALRLSAGHVLGKVGPTVTLDAGSPAHAPMEDLLALHDDGSSPVIVIIGPPELSVDLLSPAPRDLGPVLRVLAQREGWQGPSSSAESVYELLPMLELQGGGLRDERAANDARTGIHTTSDGTWVHLGQLDPDAVDERVASAVRNAEGMLVCVQPDAWRSVSEALLPRLRAVLVIGPASTAGSVAGELPARLIHGVTLQSAANLIAEAAINGRDVPVEGNIVVGETAISAPGQLLSGAARRVTRESKSAVTDDETADAVMHLHQARTEGGLPARCRMSVGLFERSRPSVGRAMAAAFLAQNLAVGARPSGRPTPSAGPGPGSGSKKIRIRG